VLLERKLQRNMHIHYHQQDELLDEIELEAEQGGDKIYFLNLLQKIENNSREWIFHQVQNKLSLEQHEFLIRRKHGLIEIIRNELKDME
jgi:hypothetical protein